MWRTRADGSRVADVPAYRRMLLQLMPGRNESAFYFEQELDLTRALPFLAAYNASHPGRSATLFHLVLWATVRTLHERPRLNRFAAGGRLWQRDGIWISYAAKPRMDDDTPLATIKQRFDPGAGFDATVARARAAERAPKSGAPGEMDREVAWLLRLPLPLLRLVLRAERAADALGLLPRRLLEQDPLRCSVFLANLGSLKMDAGHHHLFEHGNCPIFGVIGRVREAPVAAGGEVRARPVASLKWTYDERVEDGLYAQRSLELLRRHVEDPAAHGAAAPAGGPGGAQPSSS